MRRKLNSQWKEAALHFSWKIKWVTILISRIGRMDTTMGLKHQLKSRWSTFTNTLTRTKCPSSSSWQTRAPTKDSLIFPQFLRLLELTRNKQSLVSRTLDISLTGLHKALPKRRQVMTKIITFKVNEKMKLSCEWKHDS